MFYTIFSHLNTRLFACFSFCSFNYSRPFPNKLRCLFILLNSLTIGVLWSHSSFCFHRLVSFEWVYTSLRLSLFLCIFLSMSINSPCNRHLLLIITKPITMLYSFINSIIQLSFNIGYMIISIHRRSLLIICLLD